MSRKSDIYVKNTNEFLRTFTSYSFNDKEVINAILYKIRGKPIIGKPSAVGKIIDLGDYVVKISKYCPTDPTPGLLGQLCEMAQKGSLIFRIPNSNYNKTNVLAPNYLLENIIGILLHKLEKYTPCFVNIYDFVYDIENPKKPIYTIMEKLETTDNYINLEPKNDYNNLEDNFMYLLFQIIYTIDLAQKAHRFVHYDLHENNIMVRKREQQIHIYSLDNGKYIYTLKDFDFVIIDYGHSRYETKEDILTPRLIFQSPSNRDIVDRYEFNPYYDITFFFITQLAFLDQHNPIHNEQKYIEIYNRIKDICDKLLYNDIKNNKPGLQFTGTPRPKPEKIAEYIEKTSYSFNKPSNTLSILVGMIEKSQGNQHPIEFLQTHGYCILNTIARIDGIENIVYPSYPLKKRMDNTYYDLTIRKLDNNKYFNVETINTPDIDLSIKPYHNNLSAGAFDKQYIHCAVIKQISGIKNNYKWRFDCCNIDIRNIYQNKKVKSGISINASYFNILNDKLPLGIYKTDEFSIYNDIPQDYKGYFGIVGITKRGLLEIESYEMKNDSKYNQILTAGPILVWDEKIIIDESVLSKIEWQCGDNPKHSCNNIKPGEFYHASNPNPRSALIVKKNGDVILIYVEGRGQRGFGLDLNQLSQLCLKLGANHAINLDGGMSSQMVWKNEGEDLISQTNPEHMFSYPVGNVLSFISTY